MPVRTAIQYGQRKNTYKSIMGRIGGKVKMKNESLVLENIGLAYKIAWGFRNVRIDMGELKGVALLGLCKAADTFQPEYGNKFTTYATKCIQNEILIFLRMEKKHYGVRSLDEVISDTGVTRWDMVQDKENQIEKRENHCFLLEAVKRFTPKEKRILYLYYGKGMTQRKIGRIYGLSQNGISKILSGAIKKMREELYD